MLFHERACLHDYLLNISPAIGHLGFYFLLTCATVVSIMIDISGNNIALFDYPAPLCAIGESADW